LKADIRKKIKKPEERHDTIDQEAYTELAKEEIGKYKECLLCVLDENRITVLANMGYPLEYVRKTVQENEANYCLSGYYLLGID